MVMILHDERINCLTNGMFYSNLSALNVQTVLIVLLVLLVVYMYKLRQGLKYNLPPGPFCWPLIGNYEVIQAKFLHEIFVKYAKKYGPVFTVSLGPYQTVVLNDINSVTEALVRSKADFANRPSIHSVHMFTEESKDIAFANYTPTWKLHRKIAGKALSVELDDPEFIRFIRLRREANEMIGNGFVEDMFPIMYKIWTTNKYRTFSKTMNELITIVKRKFQEHEKTFDIDNVRDFTDSLILARKEAEHEENREMLSKLSETHLRQTVFDIFSAGIDTSRITLGFAVRYMASLPEIQSNVQEEIDRVVGKDRLPTVKDRDNLSYTEATLHEAMRLGLAVPVGLPHSTICDTRVGGYDVPKDTMVMINHWALHHDPRYWKDVEKFDPTRYLDGKGKLGMKPESWLPFSAGRRVCLGETVAKPELHLIFATIMQRFKITLPEGTNPKVELGGSGNITVPAPYKIIVKERNLIYKFS
ncbi:steroid 17-alpha-hydroxylase/17,20 lyase-like isoform X3 [Mytilus trossulus]|uniref:steroid 17-alpha-hydroxylase/17,20 lyase-like isoform X3 n=1 Tax=Mytilus trossulus TaxID=6551 RepID=UPI003003B947